MACYSVTCYLADSYFIEGWHIAPSYIPNSYLPTCFACTGLKHFQRKAYRYFLVSFSKLYFKTRTFRSILIYQTFSEIFLNQLAFFSKRCTLIWQYFPGINYVLLLWSYQHEAGPMDQIQWLFWTIEKITIRTNFIKPIYVAALFFFFFPLAYSRGLGPLW